jgi:hypothetical protein
MPKIVIKGKGLVKAQFLNSQIGKPQQGQPLNLNTPEEKQVYSTAWDWGASQFPGVQQSVLDQSGKVTTTGGIDVGNPLLIEQEKPNKENNYNSQTIVPAKDSWGQRTQKNLGKFYGAVDDLHSFLSVWDADKKLKKSQDAMRRGSIPDNYLAVGKQSDPNTMGDYNLNTGMYGKQGSYTVNKGQTINPTGFEPLQSSFNLNAKYGGEQNMKVRITRLPDEDEMAYGGQARHSLDIRRDALSKPNMTYEEPYEVNNTLQPVPRDEANLEAEKGETAYGDLDGDGSFEHSKIGGKRHTQGGTPLNLPEGTFIFSDTAKMKIKDPEVLGYFGFKPKSGGYTPAEIAKRYDINRYKAIMEDPNSDELRKSTAQQMVENYNKKLAYLALIQESMKGFPQGIPAVAEKILGIKAPPEEQASPEDEEQMMGMSEEEPVQEEYEWGGTKLKKYQGNTGGSTVTDNPLNQTQYDELIKMYDLANKSRNPNDILNFQKRYHQYMPNKAMEIILANPKVTQHGLRKYKKYGVKTVADLKNLNPDLIRESNEDSEWGPRTELYRTSIQAPVAPPAAPAAPSSPVMGYKCVDGVSEIKEYTDEAARTADGAIANEADLPCAQPGTLPEVKKQEVPTGPLYPDVLNLRDARSVPPRNYQIGLQQAPYSSQPVKFYDPRQALAENQSLYNSTMGALGTMGDVRTLGSVSGKLQGDSLANAAKIVGATQDQNVQAFNEWAKQDSATKNAYNQYAADIATQRGFVSRDTDVFNRNALRAYLNNVATARTKLADNQMKLGALNATNQQFNIDPNTLNIVFKQGMGVDRLNNFGAQGTYPSKQHYLRLKAMFPTLTEDKYLDLGSKLKDASSANASSYSLYD